MAAVKISAWKTVLLVVTLFALAGAPLSVSAGDPPLVTSITPSAAPNDAPSEIVITGTGFDPAIIVTLGSLKLDEVAWISAEELRVVVPWGLNPGVFPLTATNPDLQSFTLPDAFQITGAVNMWTTGGPFGGEVYDLVIDPDDRSRLYASAVGSGLFSTGSAPGQEAWSPVMLNPMPTRLAIAHFNGNRILFLGGNNGLFISYDNGITWERSSDFDAWTQYHPYEFYPSVHPLTGEVYVAFGRNPGRGAGGAVFKFDGSTWTNLTPTILNENFTAIGFHPADGLVVAGSSDGNIFKFIETEGWVSCGQPTSHVGRIAFNPDGSHEAWIVSQGQGGFSDSLYRASDDSLFNWDAVDMPLYANSYALTFQPLAGGGVKIWSAAAGGFTSINGGSTWEPLAGLKEVYDFAVDPQDENLIYAGTLRGVFRSSDGGNTWTEINTGLAGVPPLALSFSEVNPEHVITSTTSRGLMRSTNGGHTWQETDLKIGPYDTGILVDPLDAQRLYVQCTGTANTPCLYLSENFGENFARIILPSPGAGSGSSQTTAIAADLNSRLLAGVWLDTGTADRAAIFQSIDQGNTWAYLSDLPVTGSPTGNGGSVQKLVFDPTNPLTVYAFQRWNIPGGVPQQFLYKSTDGGGSWERLIVGGAAEQVDTIAVQFDNPQTLFSTVSGSNATQGIYKSTDGGTTWKYLPNQPTTEPFFALAIPPKSPTIVYAGNFSQGMYYSMDGGVSWRHMAGIPMPSTVNVLGTGVDDRRMVLYVGTSGGALADAVSAGLDGAPNAVRLLGAGVYRRVNSQSFIYLPYLRQ